ncbi:MAG: DUF2244 domain-containing protein [Yoonia sp.]
MPYEWKINAKGWKLSLWPYRSLLRTDFVIFFGSTAVIIALPLIVLLGSPILWGILPFFVLMMIGLWIAIQTSYKRGQVLETLTANNDTLHLSRHNTDGTVQEWSANIYWASVHLHPTGGPVENYLTLQGGDREVEIGSYLDVAERHQLFDTLQEALSGNPPKMG